MKRTWILVCLLLSLWAAAFSMSCRISSGGLGSRPAADDPVLTGMLGRTRVMLSGELFSIADAYFHRGQRSPTPTRWDNTFLRKAHVALHPTEHLHLKGDQIKEMMPWLWLALKADPYNVEEHFTVAVWLSRSLGKNEEAQEILRIAQINNPSAGSIYVERGRICLREGRWHEARRLFDCGLAALEARSGEMTEESRFDKADLLFYRALLDEEFNRLDEARAGYEAILSAFPDRAGIRVRLEHLGERTAGTTPGFTLTHILREQDRVREAEDSHATLPTEAGCKNEGCEHHHDQHH